MDYTSVSPAAMYRDHHNQSERGPVTHGYFYCQQKSVGIWGAKTGNFEKPSKKYYNRCG
jgi:hypothetical protein